eukprot:7461676-Heterocapsa_arctica.AAC.1
MTRDMCDKEGKRDNKLKWLSLDIVSRARKLELRTTFANGLTSVLVCWIKLIGAIEKPGTRRHCMEAMERALRKGTMLEVE